MDLAAPQSRRDLTSRRILDATVELVALKGPHLTTVRDITAATGANVSAVSYYFGSKDELVRQALATILNPLNTRRRTLLREAKSRYLGVPVPGPEILHALVQPMVTAARGSDGGRLYVRVVQQIRTYFGDALSMEIHTLNSRTVHFFLREMARTFPGLSKAKLAWRHEFARGAALHMLANCDPLSRKMSQILGANRFVDDEAVLLEIIQLTAPGFCQPGS
jgi:AcrR family transcriptional regulator